MKAQGNIKRCSKCHEWLALSEFSVSRARPDGLTVQCKTCINGHRPREIFASGRRWYWDQLGIKRCTVCGRLRPKAQFYGEKRSADGRMARCKECFKASSLARYHNNPEVAKAAKAAARRWCERNPEKTKRLKDDWRLSTHGRSVLAGLRSRRRALEVNASGSHTDTDWHELLRLCRNHCMGCGKQFPAEALTRDHIVPLSKGGSNSVENLFPLCGICNSGKGTQGPQWYHSKWATISFESRV